MKIIKYKNFKAIKFNSGSLYFENVSDANPKDFVKFINDIYNKRVEVLNKDE